MLIIKRIQKNSFFRFISSIKLAIPLLLGLASIIGVGTIIESRYNADYAKMIVYNSLWFETLHILLFICIFSAVVSRVPLKKRHIGFATTHLGMMILLVGSWVTKYYGIDGQLRVVEGQKNNQVFLDQRVLEVASDAKFQKVFVPKSASRLSSYAKGKLSSQLDGEFYVKDYLPFIEPPKSDVPRFSPTGETLHFQIQSKFFNEDVWMHSKDRPVTQMGPAKFELVVGEVTPIADDEPMVDEVKDDEVEKKLQRSGSQKLLVFKKGTDTLLKTVNLSSDRSEPFKIDSVTVRIKTIFVSAVVSDNRIAEGGDKPNPAIELDLKKGTESQREVLFAKFPEFSMNKGSNFGLKFVFDAPIPNQSQASTAGRSHSSSPQGNQVQFFVDPVKDTTTLRLLKAGKVAMETPLVEGEPVITPWMGMTMTLLSAELPKDQSLAPRPIQPKPKEDFLPPSALLIGRKNQPDKDFWLIEGQSKAIETQSNGEAYHFYYGRNALPLPFFISLDKFYKKDYPGTGRALSFESHVHLDDSKKETTVISMNEPLKKAGYTVYQSSYDMQPNRPTASIFSVNQDPGRWIKYLGSLIMALGIAIYTLMKSRFYKKKVRP